jgi:hydrogenase-4 component B
VFRARELVEMPPPSDPRPARLIVQVHDLIYDGLYAPVARGVIVAADRLNYFQFLTIRRYLSLVFFALVSLLTVLALWP